MREPWKGDWCPAPNFRVHVRLIPVLRVRYDLHVQFPAGNTLHPLSGVDVVMPRLTWPEVVDFFASHGMTDGWVPKPPAPTVPRREPFIHRAITTLLATSHAVAGAPAPLAVGV